MACIERVMAGSRGDAACLGPLGVPPDDGTNRQWPTGLAAAPTIFTARSQARSRIFRYPSRASSFVRNAASRWWCRQPRKADCYARRYLARPAWCSSAAPCLRRAALSAKRHPPRSPRHRPPLSHPHRRLRRSKRRPPRLHSRLPRLRQMALSKTQLSRTLHRKNQPNQTRLNRMRGSRSLPLHRSRRSRPRQHPAPRHCLWQRRLRRRHRCLQTPCRCTPKPISLRRHLHQRQPRRSRRLSRRQ